MGSSIDDLLAKATCGVLRDGRTVATAWLLDQSHLVSAGHVLGKTNPLLSVEVQFLDELKTRPADRIAWVYDEPSGTDFCILKLTTPIMDRQPLPVAAPQTAHGAFRLYGFGKALVNLAPATGIFIGNFHPQNKTANRLFSLQTDQAREKGFSGSAIFSEELNCVVAIQTEGTTVAPGEAQSTTILAMPIYRIAKLYDQVPTLRTAAANSSNVGYKYHIYLSYDRGGAEEIWVEKFFLDELTKSLKQKVGVDLQIFFDNSTLRHAWDAKFADGIRRSACSIPIVSASYWRSAHCRAEFKSFSDRQKQDDIAVLCGILFDEEGKRDLPEQIDLHNFEPHSWTYDGFRSSVEYGPFQEAVRKFAKQLLELMKNVPERPDKWPVTNPGSTTPPADANIPFIGKPWI